MFSLEFFPPRDDAAQLRLLDSVSALEPVNPAYVSVTFGAGGTTRDGTLETVRTLKGMGLDAAPHLSCIGSTRAQLRQLLDQYQAEGVRRIVALRGDLPSGMGSVGGADMLSYAYQLVELIREHSGDWFHIEIGAYPEMHPQASGPEADMRHFASKVKAGANSAITQYFFNADAYFDFVDRAQMLGVTIPIVPGIMPITNYSQLARFSDACGAEIPRWMRKRLEGYGDDLEAIRAFGLDQVTRLCDRLLAGGAPGLHFYTMNQAAPTLAIWERLGLATASAVPC
jgi:methylenetetrahydrofolate reductase (NADPH)